ncbi:F0F1 ATP synthase subunit epsilon, partial [Escherichia coli]|nr:F0F1 ATP synthase subunit epsilon [Escherichia coli]
HEPLLAILVPSAAEVLSTDGVREIIAVDGGFLSVADNRVSILSGFASLAREISLPEAERELAEAQRALEAGDIDLQVQQHHARA